MTDQKNNSSRIYLDKTGLIILIISLVISLTFIIMGIVTIVGENKGNDGGSETQQSSTVQSLTLNIEQWQTVTPYENVEYKFVPYTSGRFYVYANDASLSYVKDSSGNVTYPTYMSSSGYDYGYYINLQGGTEYILTFYTRSNVIQVIVCD